MDVREKLVEIIQNPVGGCTRHWAEVIADGLIAHGVTVQECKLGDKKTNADRIRSMSDEELAMLLYEIGYDGGWGALEGTLDWLRQPAEKSDKETVEEREDGDWNG